MSKWYGPAVLLAATTALLLAGALIAGGIA